MIHFHTITLLVVLASAIVVLTSDVPLPTRQKLENDHNEALQHCRAAKCASKVTDDELYPCMKGCGDDIRTKCKLPCDLVTSFNKWAECCDLCDPTTMLGGLVSSTVYEYHFLRKPQ